MVHKKMHRPKAPGRGHHVLFEQTDLSNSPGVLLHT